MTHDESLAAFDRSLHKPFSYQAARFALWAPIVAILIGIGANAALNNPSGGSSDRMTGMAWILIGGINLLLMAVGLVMGVVALVGAWRGKLKGVVGRATAGVILSGLLLGASAYFVFFMGHVRAQVAGRLVGEWHATLQAPGAPTIDSTLTLGRDKHGAIRLAVGSNSKTAAGTWGLRMGNLKEKSQLFIKWDAGQDASMGTGILWTVEHIEDAQLTLIGKNADGSEVTEHYLRVKP